jgi:methylated-DNA-protein-cysteine methyltransferase-like protein
MTEGTQRIIAEILAIPKGRVSSYGDIARRAGFQNGARQVVRALHSQSEKYDLPWYRVLRSDGFIALDGEGKALQIKLLKSEGVKVSAEGKVDLAKYGAGTIR